MPGPLTTLWGESDAGPGSRRGGRRGRSGRRRWPPRAGAQARLEAPPDDGGGLSLRRYVRLEPGCLELSGEPVRRCPVEVPANAHPI